MANPIQSPAVLIFTAETFPAMAGDGRNALLVASKLNENGYCVKLICLNPNGKLPKNENVNGVEISRINYWYRTIIGRFAFRLSLFRYLTINCNNSSKWMIFGAMPGYKLIALVSTLKGVDCVFRSTLWGFDDAESIAGSLHRFYTRYLLGKLYGYYALNSAFANSWKSFFGNFNILQSVQGVDLKKYYIDHKNGIRHELRGKLKIADGKFVILMVGHLIERKGFPEIADWLSRIDEDFLLLHIGSTEAPEWDTMSRYNVVMKNLKKYVEEKLGDRVRFLGRQNDTTQFYLSSDILLVASHAEGFPPNSVNEALAAGLPVLTRKIVGAADVIADGVNGYVFSDENEFARKLSTLIHNPIRRAELGRNARIFAEDKLDINKIVPTLQKFLGL